MKRLLTIAILALTTTLGLRAQTVEEIIEKHIDALGGAEKLSQLRSAQIEAMVNVGMFEIKSTTTVLQGKGIRSEQEIQNMKIIQAFDGTTAWMVNPMLGSDTPTKLPEEAHASLRSQMDLTGLYNYKQKGYDVTLKGEEVLDGTPVYVLNVKMPDGNNADNYISKANYYTIRTTVTIIDGERKEHLTNIYASDYRKLDGFVTPYIIEIEGEGLPGKITTKVTSARFNIDINPSIFSFPGE